VDHLSPQSYENALDMMEADGIAQHQELGALGKEIAHDEQLRREAWERGEKVERPTSPAKSLADLKAASPEPSPSPQHTRSHGR
jgi:hypothetical protein